MPDLAVVGKAGAGKSTAADFLVKEFGYTKLSFAAPLKDIAEQLWGPEARNDREKLQRLGGAVRDIDRDTWANALIGRLFVTDGPVVIDDLRFENEWWVLKGEGFTTVRVSAPYQCRVDRLRANGKWQNDAQLEHSSETAIDHLVPDHEIDNDADPLWFCTTLVTILAKEMTRR